jgi:hypothetical protein
MLSTYTVWLDRQQLFAFTTQWLVHLTPAPLAPWGPEDVNRLVLDAAPLALIIHLGFVGHDNEAMSVHP